MVTPKEYKKELLAKKVSMEMLGDVLYSYNKRAKNYRDKAREYHQNRWYPWCHYDISYEENARKSMRSFYKKKEAILMFLVPSALHKVTRKNYSESFEEYYIFYQVGNHSFHTPICINDIGKYSDLSVVDIEDLQTEGKDVADLLSVQFCDKVLYALQSGRCHIVDSDKYQDVA